MGIRLLACLASTVAARAAAPLDTCGASLDCGAEEAVLLQHQVRDAKAVDALDLPDLDKLVKSISGTVDAATAKADAFFGDTLTLAGDTVNGTLGKLQTVMDKYATMVNTTAGSVKDGVTALLAEAFNVEVPGFKASKEDKDNAMALVTRADDIVRASLASLTGVSKSLDAVPAQVFSLSDQVNASFQLALTQCQDFSAAIQDVRRILQDAASNFTQRQASLIQTTGHKESPMDADAGEVVFTHAAMMQMAAQDFPMATIASLTDALTKSKDQLSGFSSSFDAAFGLLSDSVGSIVDGKLGADSSAKVIGAFNSAKTTAEGITGRANVAFSELHSSISEGVARVGLQNAGNGLAPGIGLLGVAMLAVRLLLASVA
mmetsp:Transcript_117840/g.340626  ORF Transcript_117840/g.340626 Transcript_117840/m.340626 type:complete len:375 (-) Transcript_117840:117-1241(-)